MMTETQHTRETPESEETVAAVGSPPENAEEVLEEETTDQDGKPLENPSGG